ncbi:MAG: hypothetical protein P1S60_12455 [Anaerolineae bacterium]|nr:hypothetical protein [Anaerolineae bacterium]
MNTRNTSQALSTNLTGHIEERVQATGAARVSGAMLAYLDMCAKFHRYSPGNVWLLSINGPFKYMDI